MISPQDDPQGANVTASMEKKFLLLAPLDASAQFTAVTGHHPGLIKYRMRLH